MQFKKCTLRLKRQHPGKLKMVKWHLKLDHLTLAFLVATQLEMLATLQRGLFTVFAFSAFHTQHNLFGSFSLKEKKSIKNIFKIKEFLNVWIQWVLRQSFWELNKNLSLKPYKFSKQIVFLLHMFIPPKSFWL